VAAFSKSLAREHASSGATVNAVGVDGRSDDDDQRLRTATRYLLSDAAAFVTGQAWGCAGIPLGQPRPAGTGIAGPGIALVSGGAGGIGAAITRRLHRDGWRLVIGHVRSRPAELLARELDPTGETCQLVSLDLESPDSVRSAVRALEQSGAGLDAAVLVGGWNQTRRFVDTAAEEWSRTLAINLTGPLRLLAALDRHLRQGNRTVVGIGSESARIGDSRRAVYAAAKAGLAAALSTFNGGPDGLRAATVSPGPVDTPLLHQTHADEQSARRTIERLRRLIPLGRLGRPEEIAEVVALLCSPAGRFLAGEVISVGGGITMA
jgi:2-hydroxycyclohexanecarboxyl-CoA dehydrogenase